MLRGNRGVCFNWNVLVAAAETMNKLSLQMKTALYTNLWYFLPLVEGSVCVLVLSKARNRPVALNSLVNMQACSNDICSAHAQ